MSEQPDTGSAGALPDKMDLHEFRASRRRKTDNLLKEDHRDLKRFFALDSAAYRDLSKDGGLDEKTKELLGLVASTVLRCNDCIAYHCDRCVEVGWKKSELLDALNVALVVGGSITIPHIRTVWEVVEQLYDEKGQTERAREGTPKLKAAAAEVQTKVEEKEVEAAAMMGLPDEAKGRKARQAKKDATDGNAGKGATAVKEPANVPAKVSANVPAKVPAAAVVPPMPTTPPKSAGVAVTKTPSPPSPPVVKADKTQSKKSQGI